MEANQDPLKTRSMITRGALEETVAMTTNEGKNDTPQDSGLQTTLEIDEFLMLNDAYATAREQQELLEANKPLDLDAIREQVRKLNQELDGSVNEDAVNQAVEKFVQNRFAFKPLKPGFGRVLATAYVRRSLIGVGLGVAAGSAALVAGGIGINDHLQHLRLVEAQRGVEHRIEVVYQQAQETLRAEDKLDDDPLIALLPSAERVEIGRQLDQAQSQTEKAIERVRPNISGNNAFGVTTQNYTQINATVDKAAADLTAATQALNQARGIIKTQQSLEIVQRDLESTIATLRQANIPAEAQALRTRAENVYRDGHNAITTRDLNTAQASVQSLNNLRQDITEFGVLSDSLKQIYASARAESKEREATRQIEEIYTRATEQLRVADIASVRSAVADLQGLDATLKQTYTIRLTPARLNGEIRNGVDRIEYDNNGNDTGRVNWYMFVSGFDASGNPVKTLITNEECQSGRCPDGSPVRELVTSWGVRITPNRLEKIKADLNDDGLLNRAENTEYGQKRRGYLSTDITYPEGRLGEITRW